MNIFGTSQSLKRCKESLSELSKDFFRNNTKSINSKLTHINELQEANEGDITVRIKQLKKEEDGLLEEENLRWK